MYLEGSDLALLLITVAKEIFFFYLYQLVAFNSRLPDIIGTIILQWQTD